MKKQKVQLPKPQNFTQVIDIYTDIGCYYTILYLPSLCIYIYIPLEQQIKTNTLIFHLLFQFSNQHKKNAVSTFWVSIKLHFTEEKKSLDKQKKNQPPALLPPTNWTIDTHKHTNHHSSFSVKSKVSIIKTSSSLIFIRFLFFFVFLLHILCVCTCFWFFCSYFVRFGVLIFISLCRYICK